MAMMKHFVLAGVLTTWVSTIPSVHAQTPPATQSEKTAPKPNAAPAKKPSGDQGKSSMAAGAASLGTVHIAKKVMADGKPLAPGTYTVRLTNDEPKPAVGQTPDAERYVEFVKGGKVVGREVATVVSAADIGKIAKGPRPKANGSRVDTLKGGDYVRVWINHGGNNYIINMPPAA
jgi:hypothetical protein